MGNEVSTMDMAEFDAQNQIVSGEASPLLLPRCIRPDLFKITICDLEQGAWTEHQIQAMWAISPFISRISGGGSGRACRGLSGKRHWSLPAVGRGVPPSRPPFPEATRDFCMHFVTNFLQFTGFRKSDRNGKILRSGQIGKECPHEQGRAVRRKSHHGAH